MSKRPALKYVLKSKNTFQVIQLPVRKEPVMYQEVSVTFHNWPQPFT